MNITIEELQTLADHGKVVTDRGEKIGSIGEIYVDDLTGAPDWVTVRTGLFGTAETFVPLRTARVQGGDLVVTYARDLIKGAPRIEADGSLSPQEEQVLYRHYGVGTSVSHADGDIVLDGAGERAGRGRTAEDTAEDTTMTRSEERLVVGTQERESGRARLRKHVVTEHVTQTVPVRHDEVRVVREPVTAAERGAALSDLTFAEESYEVVLHAETPVVEKVVVPVERVRLDTVTVTGQERVSADVRKERIELDEQSSSTQQAATTSGGSRDTRSPARSRSDAPTSKPKGKKGTRRRR